MPDSDYFKDIHVNLERESDIRDILGIQANQLIAWVAVELPRTTATWTLAPANHPSVKINTLKYMHANYLYRLDMYVIRIILHTDLRGSHELIFKWLNGFARPKVAILQISVLIQH